MSYINVVMYIAPKVLFMFSFFMRIRMEKGMMRSLQART